MQRVERDTELSDKGSDFCIFSSDPPLLPLAQFKKGIQPGMLNDNDKHKDKDKDIDKNMPDS